MNKSNCASASESNSPFLVLSTHSLRATAIVALFHRLDSWTHLYFTSGRLLGSALVPFALSYVYGAAWLFRQINAALPLVVPVVIVMFVISSEIMVNCVVFASEHNWFHDI